MMTEKRFIGSYAGFYDKYKENRLLWSEWEEITRILNNLNEKSVERSKALSKLQKENNQLKNQLNKYKHLLTPIQQEKENLKHSINVENEEYDLYFATDDEQLFLHMRMFLGTQLKEWWI